MQKSPIKSRNTNQPRLPFTPAIKRALPEPLRNPVFVGTLKDLPTDADRMECIRSAKQVRREVLVPDVHDFAVVAGQVIAIPKQRQPLK